jgi:hypothetical protein
MQNLTLADIQRALSPSSTLTPSEKAEVLRLLAQLEQVADAETSEDPRSPIADYLLEFGDVQPVVRPVSWPAGEHPDIAAFVASFAPAAPPKPPEADPAVVSTVPDVPLRVPPQRRPRLLQDVIRATEDAMQRSAQSDDVDKLRPYAGTGPIDFGGAYSDE